MNTVTGQRGKKHRRVTYSLASLWERHDSHRAGDAAAVAQGDAGMSERLVSDAGLFRGEVVPCWHRR